MPNPTNTPQPSPNGPQAEPNDDAELAQLLDGPPDPTVRQPKPATPKPAPPEPGQHSDEALELAHYYGFDPVTVDSLTPAQLQSKLNQRHKADLQRRIERQHQQRELDPAPPPPAAPKLTEAEEFGFDPALVDPSILAFFRKQQAKIAELEKGNVETQRSVKENRKLAGAERLDDAFASLGEDAGKYYGEGSMFELSATSAEALRRQLLCKAAHIDFENVPAVRVLVKRLQAADKVIRPQPVAPPEPEIEEEDPNPYARTAPATNGRGQLPRDARGRFVPPSEEDFAEGGLLRPSARGRAEPDRGHSGYADPDEFDIN